MKNLFRRVKQASPLTMNGKSTQEHLEHDPHDDVETLFPIPGAVEHTAVVAAFKPTDAHVTNEFAKLATEQQNRFDANGIEESFTPFVDAAGLKIVSDVAEGELPRLTAETRAAAAEAAEVRRIFMPHVEATWGRKSIYIAFLVLLALGDLSGLTIAAQNSGVDTVWAVIFAASIAAASVTVGLRGSAIKDRHDQSRRAESAASLSKDLTDYGSFAHHFVQVTNWAKRFDQVIIGATTLGVLLVVTLVRSLANGTPDTQIAITSLAFGIGSICVILGGIANSYRGRSFPDDLINKTQKLADRKLGKLIKYAGQSVIEERARAVAAVTSIVDFNRTVGNASSTRLEASYWALVRTNPEIFGHLYNENVTASEIESPASLESLESPEDDKIVVAPTEANGLVPSSAVTSSLPISGAWGPILNAPVI